MQSEEYLALTHQAEWAPDSPKPNGSGAHTDKGQGEIGVISLGTITSQSPHLIQAPLIKFSRPNERL